MKKLLIIAALAVFAAAGTASAQNYMVVNTETIFKSMTAYNQAVEEMDAAAQQYQQNIDNAYAELEDMYETSTNPLVVYYNPAVDKTQDIISLLK